MTRYNVNANPVATGLLLGKAHTVRLVFTKGQTPMIRTVVGEATKGVSFYSRGTNRNGSKLTQKLARETGLRAGQRYELKKAGSNLYRMVPHSKVGTKSRSFNAPIITVSSTNS